MRNLHGTILAFDLKYLNQYFLSVVAVVSIILSVETT